ncbi:DUF2085 domain-containing protein [Hazenella sp. IB182353]|uniref:DUF2085 domain-containing protein n=1 Tax=Polycladospora coralii TaxID=2771432 RepID=UPI001747CBB3|nr:DUF2085 domain-containing protein [Polycladospora coralii]MBS7529267.1 DUF2085 domain-containing protein [Polycladospora coralii]
METLAHILKWVPCHRKVERSIQLRGQTFPLCARCMSILLGYVSIPVFVFIPNSFSWLWGVILQLPLLVDGFTQLWGWRESNNRLRVITGLLSGIGLSFIVVKSAYGLVEKWIGA